MPGRIRHQYFEHQTLHGLDLEEIPKHFGISIEMSDIELVPGGYNSMVLLITNYEGKKSALKIYGQRKPFPDINIAQETAQDIIICRNKIVEKNLWVPEIHDMVILRNDNTRDYWIASFGEWIGPSVTHRIQSQHPEQVELGVDRLLSAMTEFIIDRHALKVGIDPLPGNFCETENCELWYVDLMPPRYIKDGEAIVEYPKPKTQKGHDLLFWKHYKPIGILTVLLTQLCRYNPISRRIFQERIVSFLNSHNCEDIVHKLQNLEGWDLSNSKKTLLKDDLHRILHSNFIILRNVACELAYLNKINSNELEMFFKLTHCEDCFSHNQATEIVEFLYHYI